MLDVEHNPLLVGLIVVGAILAFVWFTLPESLFGNRSPVDTPRTSLPREPSVAETPPAQRMAPASVPPPMPPVLAPPSAVIESPAPAPRPARALLPMASGVQRAEAWSVIREVHAYCARRCPHRERCPGMVCKQYQREMAAKETLRLLDEADAGAS